MDTNLDPRRDPQLYAAAEQLLTAAMQYWSAYKRVTGGAAVVWLHDTDGRLVILTRGEYRDQLMANIDTLHRVEDIIWPYDEEP